MSTRLQSRRPTSRRRLSEGGSSSRRKMHLRDLDLNRYPDGSSASSADPLPLPPPPPPVPPPSAAQPPSIHGGQTIVIPDEDDDVVLLSSSSSSQARSAPIVPVILLDEDSDVQQDHSDSGVAVQEPATRLALYNYSRPERNPRKRTIINCEEYERPYFPFSQVMETMHTLEPPPPPPPPPPKEPVFNCSVCLSELEQATSTICGHIFCQKCIKASIQAQKKCPTCRKNLTMKNIHRVYLPTSK